MWTTQSILLVCAGVFVALRLLRQALLRKPIPGIPYHAEGANSLLGDLKQIGKHMQEHQEISSWLRAQSQHFDSPVYQVFVDPFRKPWVVVADFRETQDIVARRTREFDRSRVFADLFASLLPGSMVHMPTTDQWRSQRKLVGDTMNPTFINEVTAPRIHEATQHLIALWTEKARLAEGRVMDIKHDVSGAALDAIWEATFGSEIGTTKHQAAYLAGLPRIDKPVDVDAEVKFPTVPNPKEFQSILDLGKSCVHAIRSPLPRLSHSFALKFTPTLRKAGQYKDALLRSEIDKAVKKFAAPEASEGDVRCVLDLTVAREQKRAEKEGRPNDWDSKYFQDELFAFLIAGHETSATTISWGLKHLTQRQHVQTKLRQSLYDAFPEQRKAKTMPSAEQFVGTKLPYVDAVREEIGRVGGTSSAVFRLTTTDVEVLGHVIPKGTDVVCLTNGASFLDKPFDIDEKLRSKSSQESKDKNGAWDESTIGEFLPERWLTVDDAGQVEFDARAGPTMPFGGGPRGCFGRRLAEVELKLLLCMIIWSFKLEPIPPAFSSSAAMEVIVHEPQQCYVRLSDALA